MINADLKRFGASGAFLNFVDAKETATVEVAMMQGVKCVEVAMMQGVKRQAAINK